MEFNTNYAENRRDLLGVAFELEDSMSKLRHDITTEVLNIPVVQVDESPMLPTILEDVHGDQSNVSTTTTTATTTTKKKKKWKFANRFSMWVASIFRTSTRIDWKAKQYDCPKFEKSSPEKSAERLDTHVFNLKKHINIAKRYTMPKTKKDEQNHADLKKIFQDLLNTKYFEIRLEPKSTSTSILVGGGVYALFGKSQEGECCIEKFGMSNHSVGFRLTRQKKKFLFAALVMNAEQVDRFIPDRFVDAIIALALPYYNFHPDHNDYMRLNIKLQLTEMLFGIIYKNNSRPYGENLVAVPSDKVRELSKVVSFTKEQIDFFDNKIVVGGVFNLGHWETLRCRIYEIAKLLDAGEWLREKLLWPEPCTVKLGIWEMIWGNLQSGWTDSCKFCPREDQVMDVINDIRPHLMMIVEIEEELKSADDATRLLLDRDRLYSKVKKLLDSLRDIGSEKNYSSYVKPDASTKLDNFGSTMRSISSREKTSTCFTMERNTVGITSTYPNELDTHLVMDDLQELIENSPGALAITTTRQGHKVIIESSDFISFAESQPMNNRLKNAGHFSTKVDYYVATHNIRTERGDMIRARLLTYMMSLDTNNDEGAFNQARILFFPKGYFPSVPKDVKKVSIPLGIGYQEMLLIRHILGPNSSFHLLRCHGLLSNLDEDDTRSNPIEVTRTQPFVCSSPPNMDGYMEVTCNHTSHDYSLCGRNTSGYPFPHFFLCAPCANVMQKREIMFYKRTKIEHLNQQQIDRRDELVEMKYRKQWKDYDRYNIANDRTRLSKDEITNMLSENDVFLNATGKMNLCGIISGNLLYNELCENNYKLWKVSSADGKDIIVRQIYDYIKDKNGKFLIKNDGVVNTISEEVMTRRGRSGKIHHTLYSKSDNMTPDEEDAYLVENKHMYINLSRMLERKKGGIGWGGSARRHKCVFCVEKVVSGCNTCKKYVCRTHWEVYKQSNCR